MYNTDNVVLATPGKFHAFYLATELAKKGKLEGLYCSHRTIRPPAGIPWSKYRNRWDIGFREALGKLGISLNFDKWKMFDEWLAKELSKQEPGVLHGWNGGVHKTFTTLKERGWKLCVERSCPHNQVQIDLVIDEAKRLKLPFTYDHDRLKRSIEELYLADTIVVPSYYSASSYHDKALKDKVVINPLGANFPFYPRDHHKTKDKFTILLVGNNFLRKGTHYLIEAFEKIDDPNAELIIRGQVPPDYMERIKDERITILPTLLPEAFKKLYQKADVFVLPSIDEGFGMAAVEAMAYGLPLVVSENVGATQILDDRVSVKVPIRSSEAIADAIMKAKDLPKNDQFDLARKEILENNSWEKCVERMIKDAYN